MRHLSTWVLLFASVTAQGLAAAESDPIFDGVWEGSVELKAIYGLDRRPWFLLSDRPRLRIELRGGRAHVRLDGTAIQAPGGFYVETHDAGASIYWIENISDQTETVQISLTKTGADTALVFLWRMVNWKLRAPDAAESKHAFAAVGEITRSQRAPRRSR